MLQMNETSGAMTEYVNGGQPTPTYSNSFTIGSASGWPYDNSWPYSTIYWQSYPVYVCTDKTKKAIEVLKALQAEKLLKCDSVPRFIALVEKISNLL